MTSQALRGVSLGAISTSFDKSENDGFLLYIYNRLMGVVNIDADSCHQVDNVGKWYSFTAVWNPIMINPIYRTTGTFETKEISDCRSKCCVDRKIVGNSVKSTFSATGFVLDIFTDYMMIWNCELGVILYFADPKKKEDLEDIFLKFQPVSFSAVTTVVCNRWSALVATSVSSANVYHLRHLKLYVDAEVVEHKGVYMAKAADHTVLMMDNDFSVVRDMSEKSMNIIYYPIICSKGDIYVAPFRGSVPDIPAYDEIFEQIADKGYTEKEMFGENFIEARSTSSLSSEEITHRYKEKFNPWKVDFDECEWFNDLSSVTFTDVDTTDVESISQNRSTSQLEEPVYRNMLHESIDDIPSTVEPQVASPVRSPVPSMDTQPAVVDSSNHAVVNRSPVPTVDENRPDLNVNEVKNTEVPTTARISPIPLPRRRVAVDPFLDLAPDINIPKKTEVKPPQPAASSTLASNTTRNHVPDVPVPRSKTPASVAKPVKTSSKVPTPKKCFDPEEYLVRQRAMSAIIYKYYADSLNNRTSAKNTSSSRSESTVVSNEVPEEHDNVTSSSSIDMEQSSTSTSSSETEITAPPAPKPVGPFDMPPRENEDEKPGDYIKRVVGPFDTPESLACREVLCILLADQSTKREILSKFKRDFFVLLDAIKQHPSANCQMSLSSVGFDVDKVKNLTPQETFIKIESFILTTIQNKKDWWDKIILRFPAVETILPNNPTKPTE